VPFSDEDADHLRLEDFDAEHQILERLVSGDGIRTQTVGGFLDVLASDAPTPGGGAVAAVAGATGAALIEMVANLTLGRAGYEEVQERMGAILAEAETARAALLDLADRDASAFDGVMAAFKMPKETEADKAARSAAIQQGYLAAAQVPLEIAKRVSGLMELAREVTANGNEAAASDGASAAQCLSAGVWAATFNVEINAAALKDADAAAALRDEVAALRAETTALLEATNRAFAERIA